MIGRGGEKETTHAVPALHPQQERSNGCVLPGRERTEQGRRQHSAPVRRRRTSNCTFQPARTGEGQTERVVGDREEGQPILSSISSRSSREDAHIEQYSAPKHAHSSLVPYLIGLRPFSSTWAGGSSPSLIPKSVSSRCAPGGVGALLPVDRRGDGKADARVGEVESSRSFLDVDMLVRGGGSQERALYDGHAGHFHRRERGRPNARRSVGRVNHR